MAEEVRPCWEGAKAAADATMEARIIDFMVGYIIVGLTKIMESPGAIRRAWVMVGKRDLRQAQERKKQNTRYYGKQALSVFPTETSPLRSFVFNFPNPPTDYANSRGIVRSWFVTFGFYGTKVRFSTAILKLRFHYLGTFGILGENVFFSSQKVRVLIESRQIRMWDSMRK